MAHFASVFIGMAASMPDLRADTMPGYGWPGGNRSRGRWPGKHRPAGTKLARQAGKGRLGISTIH